MINTKTGRLKGSYTKTSDLIKYLESHVDVYGDTLVRFEFEGEEVEYVQFEHFKNAIIIDLMDYSDEDDED